VLDSDHPAPIPLSAKRGGRRFPERTSRYWGGHGPTRLVPKARANVPIAFFCLPCLSEGGNQQLGSTDETSSPPPPLSGCGLNRRLILAGIAPQLSGGAAGELPGPRKAHNGGSSSSRGTAAQQHNHGGSTTVTRTMATARLSRCANVTLGRPDAGGTSGHPPIAPVGRGGCTATGPLDSQESGPLII
jgi:hypothetical protein